MFVALFWVSVRVLMNVTKADCNENTVLRWKTGGVIHLLSGLHMCLKKKRGGGLWFATPFDFHPTLRNFSRYAPVHKKFPASASVMILSSHCYAFPVLTLRLSVSLVYFSLCGYLNMNIQATWTQVVQVIFMWGSEKKQTNPKTWNSFINKYWFCNFSFLRVTTNSGSMLH